MKSPYESEGIFFVPPTDVRLQMFVSVIRNIVRHRLFLSQNFNKKKLNKFGGIKEKMLYLYIINSQTQKHINHGKFNHSLHRHL
jgi:hypothetical protein